MLEQNSVDIYFLKTEINTTLQNCTLGQTNRMCKQVCASKFRAYMWVTR